jgi:hypothetical protein
MKKPGMPSLLKSYELLVNRKYKTEKAVSSIISALDNLMLSHGFKKVDVLERNFERYSVPDLASLARQNGQQEIEYQGSLGRKVEVEKSTMEGDQVLSVCAKWSLVPVDRNLRKSIRKVDAPWKESDVSTTNQKISEATANNVLVSTYSSL